MTGAYVVHLGLVPYAEAWELQRSVADAVSQGAIPDTVLFLEHPPVITVGRRTGEGELHVPPEAEVEIAETDRGGKSTFHGPGQLVCYPILDLNRHGRDVKRYVRDLESAIIIALRSFGLQSGRIEGLTGVWFEHATRSGITRSRGLDARTGGTAHSGGRRQQPRKIASIGVHVSRWVTTHGYALNVDLDPAPFTSWITACGLEAAAFTTMARELDRPVSVEEVRRPAAAAIAEVFDLKVEEVARPPAPVSQTVR